MLVLSPSTSFGRTTSSPSLVLACVQETSKNEYAYRFAANRPHLPGSRLASDFLALDFLVRAGALKCQQGSDSMPHGVQACRNWQLRTRTTVSAMKSAPSLMAISMASSVATGSVHEEPLHETQYWGHNLGRGAEQHSGAGAAANCREEGARDSPSPSSSSASAQHASTMIM